jgi:GNAT superfamily N-acetyltransferase
MLSLQTIAQLEERRQAVGLRETAVESIELAGGVVGRASPGSWHNYAVNIGMDSPATVRDIDTLIDYHASRGCEPRAEVCPYAHELTLRAFADRGFVPRLFETTLYRELDPARPIAGERALPADISIEHVARTPAAVREYAEVVVANFLPEGVTPSEDQLAMSMRTGAHPRTTLLAARDRGTNRVVGGGAMEISGEICGLFGASVCASHRGRGIQQALIAARLNFAAQQGARVACIGSKPNIPTERNVRRMGFAVAYSKVHLVRPGVDLTPMMQ